MRAGIVVSIIMFAPAAAACRGSTAPEYALDLTITDSVVARRSQNEVNLSVHVQLVNRDTRNVYFDGCGHSIQRRDGSAWRVVWSSPCQRAIYSDALYPGESRVFTFTARAAASSVECPGVGAMGQYFKR